MEENYKGIGERIIDNGYFMRDERLAGPDDGNLDIGNIIDMFSKGISLDEKVVPRDKDLTSVEEIFQEDTPLTEGIFGLSEGFTLSPITMLRRYLANKELKKEKEFADGGMAGDKTYHQVRDQFMPMDSESMGYANGGGIGSMMKPKKKRVSFRGGGMDMGNEANQAQSASMGNSSSSGNDGPRGPAELGLTTRAPPGPPSGNDEKTTIFQKIKNNPIINNPLTRVLGRVGLYSVNPTLMGLDYRTAMQLKGVYDTATEEVDEEDLKFQNGGSVGVGSMFVRKR